MGKIIGPLLIVVGIILLDLIFALTFCPLSGALFFWSLIPLAVDGKSALLMPSLYGLGPALPVIACSLVIAFSVKSLGVFFQKPAQIAKWVRRITAVFVIGAGLYLLLKNVIGF
jgi:cytochrome c-type biogenesis protein